MIKGRNYLRIDMNDRSEVMLWTGALGVPREDLEAAVARVGNLADEVVTYLLEERKIKSAALVAALRSAYPAPGPAEGGAPARAGP
jgi:hypothetical protein